MTLYLTLHDIISHAIDELMDEEIDGAQSGDNIHIFACLANQEVQKVDYGKVQNIIWDAMAYRDNRPFNPEDPVIISETEIYCSTECYAIAVLREERGKREKRRRE